MFDAIQQFQNAMRDHGLNPPEAINVGQLHRFPGQGKKNGNTAARCKLFADGRGGWFMDYSTGLFKTWQAKRDKPYTFAERHTFNRQCDADRLVGEIEIAQAHDSAANKARYIWLRAPSVTKPNGYCTRKNIQPHNARQTTDGALIVPLYNEANVLVNLQFIQANGTKRFLKGGQKKGCFWWLGDQTSTVLIAEGFATAASLQENTRKQTFIAFDAGNLANVAKIVRLKNPNAEIIIMGDNDLSGVGQRAARAAALACGGKYLVPPIAGHDFNDYLSSGASL